MLFGRKKKNSIKIADKGIAEWKYATCGYCSTGCSIEVGLDKSGEPVASRGVADADVNRGKLCVKGIFGHELFRKTAGRALFYALVIPTTMPGAFFWRNKGFEEHARESGLARMPQVGVLPDAH
jgi:hypothetical protein